tara:strand:+ start:23 stop:328 length:306 start_codon:yes stop_codon:yes gene_type:complete
MVKLSKFKIEIDDVTDVGSTTSSNSNIIFVSTSIWVEASTGKIDINSGPCTSFGPPVAGACAAHDKNNKIVIIKSRALIGGEIYTIFLLINKYRIKNYCST